MKTLVKLFMAVALAACATQARAYTVEITEDQIQAAVATMFPVVQDTPIAKVTVADPRVSVVKSTDRIRLAVTLNVAFPSQMVFSGTGEIEGDLGYDPERGEFHLSRPTVIEVVFSSLPQEYLDLVKTTVNAVARQTLPDIVIYHLDEQDIRQGMLRRVLKSVTIQDGKLIAELGW